jgi:hypothetical protein
MLETRLLILHLASFFDLLSDFGTPGYWRTG